MIKKVLYTVYILPLSTYSSNSKTKVKMPFQSEKIIFLLTVNRNIINSNTRPPRHSYKLTSHLYKSAYQKIVLFMLIILVPKTLVLVIWMSQEVMTIFCAYI